MDVFILHNNTTSSDFLKNNVLLPNEEMWLFQFRNCLTQNNSEKIHTLLEELVTFEKYRFFQHGIWICVGENTEFTEIYDVCNYLLDNYNVSRHSCCNTKSHPIRFAIQANKVRLVNILADIKQARANDCELHPNDDLHLAVYHGYLEIVKLLLKKGYNVNQVLTDGCTPLHTAALYSNCAIVKLLLDSGADMNAKYYDKTPLNHALILNIEKNSCKISEILIEHGSDIIHCIDGDGKNILHLLNPLYNRPEILKFAISKGACINLDYNNVDIISNYFFGLNHISIINESWNSYDISIQRNYPNLVPNLLKWMKILFKHGMEIDRNPINTSPLYVAFSNFPHSEIVSFLLKQGSMFDFEDNVVKEIMSKNIHLKTSYALISHAAICRMKNPNTTGPRNFDPTKLNDEQKSFYEDCMKELRIMQIMRVPNTWVRYFTILTNKCIAGYSRDRRIIHSFKKKKCKEILSIFPIYGFQLTDRFLSEKRKQDLTSEALKGLSKLLRLDQFSHRVIFDHIISQLKKKDVINLSKV